MEIRRAIAELGIRPEVLLIGGHSMHVDIYQASGIAHVLPRSERQRSPNQHTLHRSMRKLLPA
jgi:hypothetical protein